MSTAASPIDGWHASSAYFATKAAHLKLVMLADTNCTCMWELNNVFSVMSNAVVFVGMVVVGLT